MIVTSTFNRFCIRQLKIFRLLNSISVLISCRNEGFFYACKAVIVFEIEAILKGAKRNFEMLKNDILKQKYSFRESTPVFAKLMTT